MQIITIEECCEILDSQRIPITGKDRVKGEYPYYGANGIQDYVDEYLFDDELVLLAEDGGNFGSKTKPIAYRVSGKCWVNNHAHVLKPKKDIDVDFLCYSLMFYNTSGIINGATRQKLTQTAMRKMKIPLLSMNDQLKIVSIIKKLEEIIEDKRKQIDNLEMLIKARFVEMFNSCNRYKPLSELCSIITDGTHQSPKFQGSGIPFIFVSNLANNKVSYNTEKFISEETYSELYKRTPIEKGDLLLTTVGSYGHPAVVEENTKFLFQRHIAYLKPKQEVINSYYLHSTLLSPEGKHQIEEKVKGIAQKTLNLSEIKKIMIPLPEKELQNQFAEFVKQVDKSKVAIQKSLDETQVLFDSLMQKYFG